MRNLFDCIGLGLKGFNSNSNGNFLPTVPWPREPPEVVSELWRIADTKTLNSI